MPHPMGQLSWQRCRGIHHSLCTAIPFGRRTIVSRASHDFSASTIGDRLLPEPATSKTRCFAILCNKLIAVVAISLHLVQVDADARFVIPFANDIVHRSTCADSHQILARNRVTDSWNERPKVHYRRIVLPIEIECDHRIDPPIWKE